MTSNDRRDAPTQASRRNFLLGVSVVPLTLWGGAAAEQRDVIPIGDMHSHLFFMGPNPASRQPLGPSMAAGGATLVAWSLVGDLPWIGHSPKGLRQKATPDRGAATKWFREELGRMKEHAAAQGLKIATTPKDIEAALDGVPIVVLAVEGATFLDDDPTHLKMAFDAGVRHIQLVHFVRNSIGDFQTEPPQHQGLTAEGKATIETCNRLGILVDLAHCTEEVVRQALAVSKAPMVWSHSSVARDGNLIKAVAERTPWKSRQLPLAAARAIAEKGGVVGLWGLRSDVGDSVASYANRLLEMAQWLGPKHVAFGSDMNALTGSPVATYADLRRVVNHIARSGLPADDVRNIAIGNYARVLRTAMEAGQG